MGFRYRKSISFGKGFRINMSGSGIGYSYGGKGFRVTQTARGTMRTTMSVPGTGLSYVSESGTGKKTNAVPARRVHAELEAGPPVNEIKSASIEQFKASEEGDVSGAIEQVMLMYRSSNWLIAIGVILFIGNPVLTPGLLAGIALKIFARTYGRVNVEYSFDEQQEYIYRRHVQAWMALANSGKVWQIITEQFGGNVKKNAGADRIVGRVPCTITKGAPRFINTNADIVEIKLNNKEKMYVFPDKIFLIRGKKVAAISNKDVKINFSTKQFVESDPVPGDAKVVDYTWQYTNKDGTPDNRFKNNRQLPRCLYGDITITSATGLNVELQISNIDNVRKFVELYTSENI